MPPSKIAFLKSQFMSLPHSKMDIIWNQTYAVGLSELHQAEIFTLTRDILQSLYLAVTPESVKLQNNFQVPCHAIGKHILLVWETVHRQDQFQHCQLTFCNSNKIIKRTWFSSYSGCSMFLFRLDALKQQSLQQITDKSM